MFSGRAFHSLGAATENALSPQVSRLQHGWTSRCLVDEHSNLERLYPVSSSVKIAGSKYIKTFEGH